MWYLISWGSLAFLGTFLWEDLGGPEKDHDSGTAIVLRIAIIYHSRGFSIRGIPSHHQMVQHRWAGAVVTAQAGLMVIVSVRVCFTLVSVHLSHFCVLRTAHRAASHHHLHLPLAF